MTTAQRPAGNSSFELFLQNDLLLDRLMLALSQSDKYKLLSVSRSIQRTMAAPHHQRHWRELSLARFVPNIDDLVDQQAMHTTPDVWEFFDKKFKDKSLQGVLNSWPFESYLHSVVLDGTNITSWGLKTLNRTSQPWLKHCSVRWCNKLTIEHVNRLFKTYLDQYIPIALEKFEFWGSACAPVIALPADDPVNRGLTDLLAVLQKKCIKTDIAFCEVDDCFASAPLPMIGVNGMLHAYFMGEVPETPNAAGWRTPASIAYQASNKCPGHHCMTNFPKKIMCIACRRVRSCWKCLRQFCELCVSDAIEGCDGCGPLCDNCSVECPGCYRRTCPFGHSVMRGTCESCFLSICMDCRRYRRCEGCDETFCDDCTTELCDTRNCPKHDEIYCYECHSALYDSNPICDDCFDRLQARQS